MYGLVNISVAQNDLSSVKIYPNPYRPSINMSGLTIENLTQYADLRLFTISRELVRTVDYSNETGRAKWDGKNDSGNEVASGVYVLFIKSRQGEKKKMKIIVER
jgi:flagellar hook assembly protein FlgD